MSMRIERQDTVKRKIDEYSQNTEHTEEEYEKLFLDCSSILKAKWDGFCNNSNLSEKYKRVIGYAYTSYVKKLKKLGFINSENITYILEILDKNITSFCSKPIEGAYGSWGHGNGQIAINPSMCGDGSNQEFIIKVIYHKMTHALINFKINGSNPVLENTGHKYSHIEKGKRFKNLKLKNNREKAEGIKGFLHELLAEEMAQQLWYENGDRPERTEQIAGIIGFKPDRVIYSNYGPAYNRCYQQLGEEFVKNLTNINTPENNTHEKRLKALLKLCLTPSVNIFDTIYDNYCNPDETHKAKLFGTLGFVVGRAGKGGRDDVEGNKYLAIMKCNMDTGYIYTDRELFGILEKDYRLRILQGIKINTSRVLEAREQIATDQRTIEQENEGHDNYGE